MCETQLDLESFQSQIGWLILPEAKSTESDNQGLNDIAVVPYIMLESKYVELASGTRHLIVKGGGSQYCKYSK